MIAPRADCEPLPRLISDDEDALALDGPTDTEEQVLSSVIDGTFDQQRWSREQRRAVASLLGAGVLVNRDGEFRLSSEWAAYASEQDGQEEQPA